LAASPTLRAQPDAVAGITAALAGAACNLIDWIRRRAIVDFISVGWWPAFNLADAAIVIGGVLAGLSML
jgi:lipoprotein signal peptidase